MKTFRIGGVHPRDNKLTVGKEIRQVPLPKQAIISMNQHIGAPCRPCVEKGDVVKVGQLIGEPGGFVSAPIHSSVSGVVKKIEMHPDAFGMPSQCIFIDVEGDEWDANINRTATIDRICKLSKEEIIGKIKNAGIVGLGGACFPTHVKLMPPPDTKAEILIINAAECEPYLTCDHQLIMEHGEEILIGVSLLMKALEVENAVIGIEDNKRDAIESLEKLNMRFFGINICPLKQQYPQGGEKQLIDATIGRQVSSGALPISVGAVVQNVATCFAVYEAVQKNKPLIERVATVTGKSLEAGGNFKFRFGTPHSMLIDMVGGLPDNTGKVVAGGPMMGKAMRNIDSPTSKRTSGILIFSEAESKRREEENCIRCGKCISACPMGLEPYLLITLAERKMWDRMEEEGIMDCIECGCCLYSCPSYRPLLDYVRLGKATVGNIIRNRNTK